ncbi:MAG TPA: UMP kinase [Bacteroidetes bacterium]|nr:UMP kinase [Bacteroidota bacterium]
MQYKYKRILLKLSGESLQGAGSSSIDPERLAYYGKQIMELVDSGIETGIVMGGGNIFRGLQGIKAGFDRVKGDQMGMLATVINSLALESELRSAGCNARLFTSVRMEPVGELYKRDRVSEAMRQGIVCLLAGGTGNPFFTTDTAAALRAVETGCEALLKGTRVDGVYSDDPEKTDKAEKFEHISFEEVISRQLAVMDQTAFTMCRENKMPIIVFDMNTPGNLLKVVRGENVGTIIYDG